MISPGSENRVTVLCFPWVTVTLIALSVAVFLGISVLNNTNPVSLPDTFACLREQYPQCIQKEPNIEKVIQCAAANFKEYTAEENAELCNYSITGQCLVDKAVLSACFSVQWQIFSQFGFIPAVFSWRYLYTLVSHMFLHENFKHLLNNMISLFLVGMFVETRLRKKKYLLLYFLSGIGASLLYYGVHASSYAPAVGASGAIFGLLGANLALDIFKIRSNRIPYFFGITFPGFSLPYLLVVFLSQMYYNLTSTNAGVAFSAHVGGFILGAMLTLLLMDKKEVGLA